MTGLRRAILFMLVFLTIFFNIERLDYSDQTLIDLHTFVYVLVAVLILSTLLIRFLQRLTANLALPLWLGIYLALKLTLFNNRPLIGGIYTYLSITEMVMVAIGVLLTINLMHFLNEMEGFAAKTIFPKRNHRVKDLHEAEEDIKTEFIRSRRHHRPLAVIVVEMDKFSVRKNLEQGFINVQQLMVKRFALASLGQTLTKVLRRTDVLLEPDEQDGFIILCPETGVDGADVLAHRIRKLAENDLGLTVQIGTAAFPEEAITFDDLLQKARGDMLQPGDVSKLTIAEPSIVKSAEEKPS